MNTRNDSHIEAVYLLTMAVLLCAAVGCRGQDPTPAVSPRPTRIPWHPKFAEYMTQVCASTTARTIDKYQQIQSGMSFEDICRIVGSPDQDVGSGLYIFVYELDDGSVVYMGFASLSTVMYVSHDTGNGPGEWIVGGE